MRDVSLTATTVLAALILLSCFLPMIQLPETISRGLGSAVPSSFSVSGVWGLSKNLGALLFFVPASQRATINTYLTMANLIYLIPLSALVLLLLELLGRSYKWLAVLTAVLALIPVMAVIYAWVDGRMQQALSGSPFTLSDFLGWGFYLMTLAGVLLLANGFRRSSQITPQQNNGTLEPK